MTKLYIDVECGSTLVRHALFLTEAFNSTVDRAAYIGDSTPDGLPIERVDVGAGGTLLLSEGNPLRADYVFTQPGIELAGERVATGTNADLVLWRTDGPVRVVGATTNADVSKTALRLANASQVAARVERDEELLALAIDHELVRRREERLDGL